MPNSQIHLQQLGWIDCVPKTTDLQECNPNKTLTSQKHLSTDQEGMVQGTMEVCVGSWNAVVSCHKLTAGDCIC